MQLPLRSLVFRSKRCRTLFLFLLCLAFGTTLLINITAQRREFQPDTLLYRARSWTRSDIGFAKRSHHQFHNLSTKEPLIDSRIPKLTETSTENKSLQSKKTAVSHFNRKHISTKQSHSNSRQRLTLRNGESIPFFTLGDSETNHRSVDKSLRIANRKLHQRYLKREKSNQNIKNTDPSDVIVNGIYWSKAVEESIPKGLTETEADRWLSKVKSTEIHNIQSASWDKCGRPQNAFAQLADRSRLCVRYRAPRDRLVYGEVLSYWLSRLLGLDCVPPVSLAVSDDVTKNQTFKDQILRNLGWQSGKVVALMRWEDAIASSSRAKVNMPAEILHAYTTGRPITGFSLLKNSRNEKDMHAIWTTANINNMIKDVDHQPINNDINNPYNITNQSIKNTVNNTDIHNTQSSFWHALNISGAISNKSKHLSKTNGELLHAKKQPVLLSPHQLGTIAQWGTMIIFDYLTGNYDRVASMQDGADRENDTSILQRPIRNLRQSQNSKLWLIDNESGLLDAYTLLFLDETGRNKFMIYHDKMLQTMCVFQQKLVRALDELYKETLPHNKLLLFARRKDNLFSRLDQHDESFILFKENFTKRLNEVMNWIQFCRENANKSR